MPNLYAAVVGGRGKLPAVFMDRSFAGRRTGQAGLAPPAIAFDASSPPRFQELPHGLLTPPAYVLERIAQDKARFPPGVYSDDYYFGKQVTHPGSELDPPFRAFLAISVRNLFAKVIDPQPAGKLRISLDSS